MEAQKKTNKVTMMLEQEKAKNKKLQLDFDQMVGSFQTQDSDTKQIKDNTVQTLILKNQKLEVQIKETDNFKKEIEELKLLRDKQQQEFKFLYEDKQKLFE